MYDRLVADAEDSAQNEIRTDADLYLEEVRRLHEGKKREARRLHEGSPPPQHSLSSQAGVGANAAEGQAATNPVSGSVVDHGGDHHGPSGSAVRHHGGDHHGPAGAEERGREKTTTARNSSSYNTSNNVQENEYLGKQPLENDPLFGADLVFADGGKMTSAKQQIFAGEKESKFSPDELLKIIGGNGSDSEDDSVASPGGDLLPFSD